jgi:S1-C subfamily serine protease
LRALLIDHAGRTSGALVVRPVDDRFSPRQPFRGDITVSLKVLVRATPILAGVAAMAGCGATSSATTSPSAETIQSKFVNVVTNAHVVPGAKRFTVTLSGGKRLPATLVGTNPGSDLAVIHLTRATPSPAAFGDSAKIEVGYLTLAIGNPLGLHSSVSQGIVSSVSRTVSEGDGVTLTSAIQTSAEINPGNSGGALADLNGRVIGIPTLAALDPEFGGTPAPGIGFAIASNRVKSVATSIIAGT